MKETQIADIRGQVENITNSKDYVLTSNAKKIELIDLVIKNGYSMKLASEISGVKHSTVKYIIKSYKTDKKSFMKKISTKKKKITQIKQQMHQAKQSEKQNIIIDTDLAEPTEPTNSNMTIPYVQQNQSYWQNKLFSQNFMMQNQVFIDQYEQMRSFFYIPYFC